MIRILILADDCRAADDVALYAQLRYPDAVVVTGSNRGDVSDALVRDLPSLVILHSALSSEGTLQLIERIRSQSDVAILVLGEKGVDTDRVRWLESGADDVVSSPYSPLELMARCQALLRRANRQGPKRTSISFERLTIQADAGDMVVAGRRVHLTPTECALLSALAENAGQVVSQNDLIERVWGPEYRGDSDLLKAHVYRLRNKLGQLDDRDHIKNDRGFGYRCEA